MKKDRHSTIIEYLETNTVCTATELSELLDCSEMTIRRDFTELEKLNLIQRKHGCAYLTKNAKPSYFQQQIDEQRYEKEAIAKAAVDYFVRPYSVISMDTSTTAHTVSRFLPDNMPLSVITPNLMTALILSDKEDIQTFVPGGILYHRSKSTIIDEEDVLKQHPSDVAFISTRTFRIPGGAFEHTYQLVDTKRHIVSNAKKTVLLLDHTKFKQSSLCKCIPLNSIDVIITDEKAPKDIITKAAGLGKEIIIVDTATKNVLKHYSH